MEGARTVRMWECAVPGSVEYVPLWYFEVALLVVPGFSRRPGGGGQRDVDDEMWGMTSFGMRMEITYGDGGREQFEGCCGCLP